MIEIDSWDDERKARLIAMETTQRQLDDMTWKTLQEHGVTEATELRLDFFFNAPSFETATALHDFLQVETDYDLAIDREPQPVVSGATQPTTISREILDQWVGYMCGAAVMRDCEFDGWGGADSRFR